MEKACKSATVLLCSFAGSVTAVGGVSVSWAKAVRLIRMTITERKMRSIKALSSGEIAAILRIAGWMLRPSGGPTWLQFGIRTLNNGYLWVNIRPFLRFSSLGTQRDFMPAQDVRPPPPFTSCKLLKTGDYI